MYFHTHGEVEKDSVSWSGRVVRKHFSSWQGWHCVLVLCALRCAKNCVGQHGKVMLV